MRKLEIEPLEKQRWDRIERELRERLESEPVSAHQAAPKRDSRPPRPLFGLVLAGAAAAAIGAVAWEKVHTAPAATEHAPEVARVETQDAPSRVEFGGATLEVAAHSAARMEGSYATGVMVSLDHGEVDFDVAPRHDRPPFVVRAGDVDVRVVGTHFRVDREDGATHVSVQRGVVEVESHGVTTRVPAGSAWPETAENVQPEPRASVVLAPPARPSPKPRPEATIAAPPEPQTTVAPAPSARDRYDRALTLERSQPDEALSTLRELASGDGAWAMNALYEEARFELERGDKDSARKLFAEYLRRYPTGPNANDAKELSSKLP